MNSTKIIEWSATPDVAVGDVLHVGRFGGAYCSAYRVTRRLGGLRVEMALQRSESFRRDDGSFGSRWVDA